MSFGQTSDVETFLPQTRRFDSKLNDTVLMRVKETGNDYRYFPEPDIPYINLTDEHIDEVVSEIPMMPDERRKIYISRGVSEINTDKMINHREMSDFLNGFIDTDLDFKTAVNLLLGDIASYLNKNNKELKDTKLDKDKFYSVDYIPSRGKNKDVLQGYSKSNPVLTIGFRTLK